MDAERNSTRIRRIGIASIAGFDAIAMAARTYASHAAPLFVAMGAISIALAVSVACAPGRILPAVLLLVALRMQSDRLGAIAGVYDETFYAVGATLLGFILGSLVARAMGADARRSRDERTTIERFAASGALGMLTATWVTAGISKVRAAGFGWVSTDTLRMLIVIHERPGHSAWRAWIGHRIVESPSLAMVLTVGALASELGAILLLCGRRPRLVVATALIAFHVGTLAVAGIFFVQTVALLIVLAVPWDRFLASPNGEPTWSPETKREGRTMWAFIGGTALLIAIVWIVPITPRAHPLARANEPVASTTASSDRETAIAHYGPLAAGVALSDGFVIRRITVRARIARIETSDDRGRTLVFELAPPGVDMPRGPFDAGTAAMLVRQTDLASDVYQPVGNALLDLLRKAAAPGALDVAIAHWIQAHAERAP